MAIIRASGATARLAALAVGVLAWAMPAQADWRADLGTFRIGMVARPGSGATIEGAQTIREAYSRALGMPVEIFVARDLAALIDAQASARIEYAVHTAMSYAVIDKLCDCVEPLAAPLSNDGSTGIRSVLVARQGGPGSTDDLAGWRVMLGPEDSLSGHMMPIALFRPGATPLTGREPFLSVAGSESEAERKFIDGEIDAMFGHEVTTIGGESIKGGTLARLLESGATGFKVLWTSDFLRYGPHVIRSGLPGEARQALLAFLVGLHERDAVVYDLIEKNFSGGFAAVSEADYATARSIAEALSGARGN